MVEDKEHPVGASDLREDLDKGQEPQCECVAAEPPNTQATPASESTLTPESVFPETPLIQERTEREPPDEGTTEPGAPTASTEQKPPISQLTIIEESVTELTDAVASLSRQQEMMQNGIRQLGSRVSDAATSLGAPRVSGLLLRLLLLYDIVDPPAAHLGEEAASVCRVMAGQIEQLLAVNGFFCMETDGAVFDPVEHKPVKVVSVKDPGMDGRILSTVRKGFRSEHGVLRPAEVVLVRAPKKAIQSEDVFGSPPDDGGCGVS
jgi:molecular chaperone GrpE (heat shock protein)